MPASLTPLIAVADVQAGPAYLVSPGSLLQLLVGIGGPHLSPVCGSGKCLGEAGQVRGLTWIFPISFGGLQTELCMCAGLPWPRLWHMSELGHVG